MKKMSDSTYAIIKAAYDNGTINNDTFREICKRYGI